MFAIGEFDLVIVRNFAVIEELYILNSCNVFISSLLLLLLLVRLDVVRLRAAGCRQVGARVRASTARYTKQHATLAALHV